MSFRFNRDKRFFRPVTYNEFLQAAFPLAEMIFKARPDVQIEILTCDDMMTHAFATTSFLVEGDTEALEKRKSYNLDEFTEEVWKHAFHVYLVFRIADPSDLFMVALSVDRAEKPRSLEFYGQALEPDLEAQIELEFAWSNLSFAVRGYPAFSFLDVLLGHHLFSRGWS